LTPDDRPGLDGDADDRRTLDGDGEEQRRRIERPLPVLAPSAFMRIKFGHPLCGRSKRVGRSGCARSHRVSRI
jgi:hypothetical protein